MKNALKIAEQTIVTTTTTTTRYVEDPETRQPATAVPIPVVFQSNDRVISPPVIVFEQSRIPQDTTIAGETFLHVNGYPSAIYAPAPIPMIGSEGEYIVNADGMRFID